MKRAAFFDIDGTLTSENVWRGIMAYFKAHRLRRATYLVFLAIHTPLILLRLTRLISETSFRAPWAANLAWFVRGMTISEASLIWDWVAEDFLDANNHWRPDSCRLVGEHLAEDDLVMLVSSGPEPLISRLAEGMGVAYAVGTRLEVGPDGRYTGRSLPPVCIDIHKASLVQQRLASLGQEVDFSESFAYADSISDLGLLELVGHPVAVYPDPALRVMAVQRGWEIFEQVTSRPAS